MQFKSLAFAALASLQFTNAASINARDDIPSAIAKATYDKDHTHFDYELIFKDGLKLEEGVLSVNFTLSETNPDKFGWDNDFGILSSTNLKPVSKDSIKFGDGYGQGIWNYKEDGNTATLSLYANNGGKKIDGAKILAAGKFTPKDSEKGYGFSKSTTEIKNQPNDN
ncbi:putative secreted protein [Wickerhamomyces ciferrii]|uniref:Secreted protein n=1 Tax=Wickerhamomyces ciferrii (strain ATCC 14091 / BCRC 22168 / CBS 111 / JCM 3599 / NBRC 0793 / NRRL Y-1031 F-60-10) TaxID=1206466 RepID=K0KZ64_WICCF|nr:uncharacterized protein BN7_6002 [Wickerhamomyces ciferrii]CCH46408.1 putative secreted protein [Wickerhamomyces ciferrii]